MDFQVSKLFKENGIYIPNDVPLIFRSDLYTQRISVLGNIDDVLKQDIENIFKPRSEFICFILAHGSVFFRDKPVSTI